MLIANKKPIPGCAKCEKGRIRVPQAGGFGRIVEMCECQKKCERFARIQENFSYEISNIRPAMLAKYPIETYDTSISRQFLDVLLSGQLANEKKRLYIHGTPGTGKTYTAIMSMILGLYKGLQVLYTNVPKLMDDLRPNENDQGKVWMQRCMDADLLVLDDIGQEKGSERVLERLYIIINERYVNDLPTVFTSNFSLADLQIKIKHQAILSRIRHLSIDIDFGNIDKRGT